MNAEQAERLWYEMWASAEEEVSRYRTSWLSAKNRASTYRRRMLALLAESDQRQHQLNAEQVRVRELTVRILKLESELASLKASNGVWL